MARKYTHDPRNVWLEVHGTYRLRRDLCLPRSQVIVYPIPSEAFPGYRARVVFEDNSKVELITKPLPLYDAKAKARSYVMNYREDRGANTA